MTSAPQTHVVRERRSYVAGLLLAALSGPLGLLGSGLGLGLATILLALAVGVATLGLGAILVRAACTPLSPVAIALRDRSAG